MSETMDNTPHISTARRSLTTPRAAAIAGVLFALLYGASLVLIRWSIPADPMADSGLWLETNAGRISLALNLMPYAGIAFLWFIGVIRDQLGDLEDRFFATVFLGSGLIFLALTFVSSALAGGLLSSYAVAPNTMLESGVFTYSRAVMFQITNVYAVRMAGVFMISLGTIWLRTGLMHRGWTIVTYTLALILLLSIGFWLWVTLIFPIWVLIISLYILYRSRRDRKSEASNVEGE